MKLSKDFRLQEHADSRLKLLPVLGIEGVKITNWKAWHPTASWLILSTSQWSSWFESDSHLCFVDQEQFKIGLSKTWINMIKPLFVQEELIYDELGDPQRRVFCNIEITMALATSGWWNLAPYRFPCPRWFPTPPEVPIYPYVKCMIPGCIFKSSKPEFYNSIKCQPQIVFTYILSVSYSDPHTNLMNKLELSHHYWC